jgi:hypothetical protein
MPTTTTAPALQPAAGELEQLLTHCLSAAQLHTGCHRTITDHALSYWLLRPLEAAQLLTDYHHVSPAHRGVLLIRWGRS